MQRTFLSIALCTSLTACSGYSRAADDRTAPAVLPGKPVLLQVVADAPARSRGGTVVVDGEYDLVANKLHIGLGGDTNAVPRTVMAERLIIDGGKIKFVTTQNGVTTSAVASLSSCRTGLGLTFTSGPSAGTTRTIDVSDEGDALEILDQNLARTYVVRTGSETGVEPQMSGSACK